MDATDAARWHTIFMLLGMERVAPFWADMGLTVPPSPPAQEAARAFVRGYRAIENDPTLPTDRRLAAYQDLLDRTLARLDTEAGPETARAIADWGTGTFPYDSGADGLAFVWRFLLRRLAGVGGEAYPLVPPPLPAPTLDRVRRAITTHLGDAAALRRRLQGAEAAPRTDWEEQIYATYTPGASPLDWVENTVEFVRTRAAWREIAALLSDDELERLRQWGGAQAAAMEMGMDTVALPSFPGAPPRPDGSASSPPPP